MEYYLAIKNPITGTLNNMSESQNSVIWNKSDKKRNLYDSIYTNLNKRQTNLWG